MSDALCGPSNALQNFQKHASVDRTLQQDRLSSRHSPSQGFRSAPGPNAGVLDSDFEAFQTGHPGPQPENLTILPGNTVPNPFAFRSPPLPDWAADFQRLHVSTPPLPAVHQTHNVHVQPSAHTGSLNWHQDFLSQQAPSSAQQANNHIQYMPHRPMANLYGSPYLQQPTYMPDTRSSIKGKQVAGNENITFDDAAFDRAFDTARAEMLDEPVQEPVAQSDEYAAQRAMVPADTDAAWLVLRTVSIPAYLALNLRFAKERDQGNTVANDSSTRYSQRSLYLGALEHLERQGMLTDKADIDIVSELLRSVSMSNSSERQEPSDSQHMIGVRGKMLLQKLQETKSEYHAEAARYALRDRQLEELDVDSLGLSDVPGVDGKAALHADLEQGGTSQVRFLFRVLDLHSPSLSAYYEQTIERVFGPLDYNMNIKEALRNESLLNQRPENLLREMHRPIIISDSATLRESLGETPPAQEQQDPPKHDDEDLARTAGQLLDSVSHDTSAKFQQSNFLALMRRLRDHEVRVEGDKMVETKSGMDGSEDISSVQNDLDLGRDDARRMTGALQSHQSDDHDIGGGLCGTRTPLELFS
ncbi:hypothetical protein K490DRAFT_63915 [Saccharata proteae CBS 121410]|uniref:Uncharacterized protein n=1 Tax=Saccharata proteae CBS 121410 TaxID=1314787 RepID=A0A6A5YA40_9PEZI|nr:hypothetical protein K490DRAFT_63915 [Saccharata proteae CBS 121410]